MLAKGAAVWLCGNGLSCGEPPAFLELNRILCIAIAAMPYYIGIDVGTTSARAAIIKVDTDKYAQVLDSAVTPITIWNESPDHFEQSSDNIWQAVISCVTQVMQKSKLAPSQIEGVGFDATCSLVVLDKQEQPLSVSPTKAGTPGDNDR